MRAWKRLGRKLLAHIVPMFPFFQCFQYSAALFWHHLTIAFSITQSAAQQQELLHSHVITLLL